MNQQDYLTQIDQVNARGPFRPTWESLATMSQPAWYQDAKLVIFIHWGVYSVPAFGSEWYPRLMYYRGTKVFDHHQKTYGPEFNYRDFIPMFKAENFDPAAWLQLIKESGARFILPVGEHHDGFKMYASDFSPYNAAQMGPHRDVMAALHQAADHQGIHFSISSHRAEHFWFFNGGRTVGFPTEVQDDQYRDFYGPAVTNTTKNNEQAYLLGEQGIVPTAAWLDDWLVNSAEMVDRFHPATMYFDWWISEPAFRSHVQRFAAYYYNRAREWGCDASINYKYDALMYGTGTLVQERGTLGNIAPRLWQAETATARHSWGYTENNEYKSPAEIAQVFADVISKNGVFCLNIGPQSDGTLAPEDVAILQALGEWNNVNQEAIWGTGPYKFFGQGTQQQAGTFSEDYHYGDDDYRFTYRPGALYVFALAPNNRTTFTIAALKKDNDGLVAPIKKATILADGAPVATHQDDTALTLTTTQPVAGDMPMVFKLALA
ncbi:MAG: alpha-L-fucosidase [Schleiferilactobacillus harbinensis]|jgi:alpha-L-fucosidase|nr:alpha-L-fucosidase [Schleiferilactobacillus harbinensis]MCI1913069.1 alpha-L-fucosidase [Schleiferilactobacillus harbinensis]